MKPRVFFTAPHIHPDATGEEYVAWRWAEALSSHVDLTVFSYERDGRIALAETLPKARVLSVPMPKIFAKVPRFEAMAKPYYPHYARKVRDALRLRPGAFDLAHQIMPQAPRYPTPLRNMGLPYVLGPVGGTLATPKAFRKECRGARWFTRARALDGLRLKHDPWLRDSLSSANVVLGVAPYMFDVLADVPIRCFQSMLELGVENIPPAQDRRAPGQPIRLLHVGRGVRTKGLRDAIRALAHLREAFPNMTLTSAGAGEDIPACQREAEVLGVRDRVRFLGPLPREKVEELYQSADIFVFPSFRETAGNVVYEAMRWGLPVIAAARGGPDWIVDDTTGIRIPVTEPDHFARDIAEAIRSLANDPMRRHGLGMAARQKLMQTGTWTAKGVAMAKIYEDVLDGRRRARPNLAVPPVAA